MSATRGTRVGRWQFLALLATTAVVLPPGGPRLASAQAGALDLTFGNGGQVTTIFAGSGMVARRVNALAVQSDGRIVAVGFGESFDGDRDGFAVARYHADGTLDATFGTGGFAQEAFAFTVASFGAGGLVTTPFAGSDVAYAVAVQPDGKIVAAGSTAAADAQSVTSFALARYDEGP